MKKALVVFLLFALVGTGAFAAPTFVWNGHVTGGVAAVSYANNDDGMVFGTIAPDSWVNGTRAQLQLSFTNADRNAGVRARLRTQTVGGGIANATGEAAGFNHSINWHQAWGWVRLFDDIVEARAGRIWDDQLATGDPIFGASRLEGLHGVMTYIRPAGDLLTLGFGATSPYNIGNAAEWDAGSLRIWGGAGVNIAGLVFRAQLDTAYQNTNAQASVNVRLLDGIPIDVFGRFLRLDDFSDAGRMDLRAFVGLNIFDGMSLNFGGGFSTLAGDNDPHIMVGGWATFAMGALQPRLDVWFATGGQYVYTYGLHAVGSVIDFAAATWNSDQSFLNFRPALRLRAGAGHLELGCVVNIDLGSVSAVSPHAGTGATIAPFAAVHMTF